jgi:hypothetical protein
MAGQNRLNWCSLHFEHLRSLSLEIDVMCCSKDISHSRGELVMTLEAQRVKKIDGLSGMEGVLRVEKEWLWETEHTRI